MDVVQNRLNNLSRWLTLLDLPGVGPVHFRRWYDKLGSDFLTNTPWAELAQRLKLNEKQRAYTPKNNYQALLASWLDNAEHHVLTWQDSRYPELLAQTHASPPVLFVKGSLDALHTQQIAIVGSRHPSHTGLDAAQFFTKELIHAGFAITSGLAIGIDGASHTRALQEHGVTLAVLGSGLECIYPKRHIKLAQDIVASGGALLSEYLPKTPPCALHFPRRNRIISGLSLGTLVVEASEKSGSLITARYAMEQNREVFALPGVWHSSNSCGGHRLIQQGAKLIFNLADILEEVGMYKTGVPTSSSSTPRAAENEEKTLPNRQLLDNVGHEATAVDVIAARSNLPVDTVLSRLIELELNGWVAAVPGGYVKTRRG